MPLDNLIIYLASEINDIAEDMVDSNDASTNRAARNRISALCHVLLDAHHGTIILDKDDS